MSCTEVRSDDTTGDAGARTVDMKFEVVTIPAVDVVCATALYRSLGWREDVEPRARRDPVLHEAHVGRILRTAAAGHDEHERRRVAELAGLVRRVHGGGAVRRQAARVTDHDVIVMDRTSQNGIVTKTDAPTAASDRGYARRAAGALATS
jgi:hypothetical protein